MWPTSALTRRPLHWMLKASNSNRQPNSNSSQLPMKWSRRRASLTGTTLAMTRHWWGRGGSRRRRRLFKSSMTRPIKTSRWRRLMVGSPEGGLRDRCKRGRHSETLRHRRVKCRIGLASRTWSRYRRWYPASIEIQTNKESTIQNMHKVCTSLRNWRRESKLTLATQTSTWRNKTNQMTHH